MSNIQEASDYIKRQANLHKSFVTLADELDKIGSITNAAKEAKADRDKAVAEKTQAQADLKALKDQIEAAHSTAADVMIKGANEATHQAELTASKAKDDAKAVVDKANAQAQLITDKYNNQAAQADGFLLSLKAETDAELFKLAAAKADLEIAQKEHDKLVKAVEALKAKFA